MTSWVEALNRLYKESRGFVLLTILETKGSGPRDMGSKMVVTVDDVFDTIGGGALEFESIKLARKLLKNTKVQHTQTFNLGQDLKQCCGGVMTVFFEVFPAINFDIVIFGAGHIGKALIKILSDIDCQVKWFDSRPEQFPQVVKAHIEKIILSQPELAVESCQANSYFLVMTHDHALDQQLVEAILSRTDSAYCGLVGSDSKGLKFRHRLQKIGFSQQSLGQLTCPIGLSPLKTKVPMEIAVSIVADILTRVAHTRSNCIDRK